MGALIMRVNVLQFKNFNKKSPYISTFIDIKDNTYIFTLRWSDYCDCAFLSIMDYDNNPIITGKALVNNLRIRHNKLPYIFVFTHLYGKTYEPTIDNIASEFALTYVSDDESEE